MSSGSAEPDAVPVGSLNESASEFGKPLALIREVGIVSGERADGDADVAGSVASILTLSRVNILVR